MLSFDIVGGTELSLRLLMVRLNAGAVLHIALRVAW